MNKRIHQVLVGCGITGTELRSDDTPFTEFGVDSLKTVEVMLAVEQEFDLVFPEEYLTTSTFRSVSSVASVVADLVRMKDGGTDGQ